MFTNYMLYPELRHWTFNIIMNELLRNTTGDHTVRWYISAVTDLYWGVMMCQNGTMKRFKCWSELKCLSRMIFLILQTTICINAGTFLYKSVYCKRRGGFDYHIRFSSRSESLPPRQSCKVTNSNVLVTVTVTEIIHIMQY